MIDITKYLNTDLIIHDLGKCTRDEAIKALIAKIFQKKKSSEVLLNQEDVFKSVMEREGQQTTGIGNGLAFPHARINGWKDFSIAMGISREGIEFDSLDKMPVNYVFVLISSHEEPYIILQTMSTLIRFLVEDGYREKILNEDLSSESILNTFKKCSVREEEQILAGDLIRPLTDHVDLDTSVEEAARKMHLDHFDTLAVVDGEGKYCGEVSCLDIFKYGMPDFFNNLSTISFVRHIDPFEKYFRIKGNLKVKDIYKEGTSTIPKDATLLEIIFEMTTKNKLKLFVVEEDRTLLGVIDRFCVIDKILFF